MDIAHPEPITKIRTVHKIAAWLYAKERDRLEISTVTGFPLHMLDMFIQDSMLFGNLVAEYQHELAVTPSFNPIQAAETTLADAVELLQERVVTEGETLPTRDLLNVIEMLSSRTNIGLNPKEPVKNTDNLTPEDIQNANESAQGTEFQSLPNIEEALERRRDSLGLVELQPIPREEGEKEEEINQEFSRRAGV